MVVSDLHYSLKQFDWLVAHAAPYDLVIIAGDLMELGSYVEPEVQAAVVERYFQKICEGCPLVVCSGNHDLVDEGDGTRSAEWLADLSIPNLFVDCGCFEDEKIRVLSLPWWEGDAESAKVGDWLATQFLPEEDKYNMRKLEVIDGLAANGEEGNGAVEEAVKAKVKALCDRFPIYEAS